MQQPPNEAMQEPYLSQFRRLIRNGAGTLDIQDGQTGSSYTLPATADEALIDREVDRVRVHRESICRLLEAYAGPSPRVLDVGCGTGATTVAVSLSPGLDAREVVGVDPNASSIGAAEVRAKGHGVSGDRISFRTIVAGDPLPFDVDSFDLTLCVSVIEYLATPESRHVFARDLLRVTRPGGTVCLVTPNPFRLQDYHTGRWFGDWRRQEGYPWASRPAEIRDMFRGCAVRFLRGEQLAHGLTRRGVPGAPLLGRLGILAHLLPWQKVLVRKP